MYQTMSPENLPSSSTIRKSNNTTHFKSSKLEDQIITSSLTSTQNQNQQEQQQQQQHQISQTQTQITNPTTSHGHSHSHESSSSRDVLLQWGQRKRSRCSRSESRSISMAANNNSSEKHQITNHIIPMPPPPPPPPPHPLSHPHPSSVASTSSNGSRTPGTRVRPNGLLYSKDSHGFLPSKNRKLADQMGCTNGTSPSRNGVGGSRTISRSSIGKRSPSMGGERNNEKKVLGSGSLVRKVKSDDSLGNGNHHHLHIESTEHEINNNGGHHHSSSAATMARSPVNEGEKGNGGGEVVEWPRIYISLSRKEKEDDFYAMKGTKLPHRPKKRAKAVDRALQYCFPGLWLSDLTRARYEVRERKSAKKPKRRGLKGLENMESESE